MTRQRLHRWRQLSRRERRLLAVAVWRLWVAFVRFRRTSVELLLSDLDASRQAIPGTCPATPQQVGWAVEAASRAVPWRADCMIAAMAAADWLKRLGYQPKFHIGVHHPQSAADLAAHAWLTLDGGIIVGGEGIAPGGSIPVLRPSADKQPKP